MSKTKVIHKYSIQICDSFRMLLPCESEILHAGMQDGTPCMWVKLNKDEREVEERRFAIIGTGHGFGQGEPEYYEHIKTFFDRQFVWHLFEIEV